LSQRIYALSVSFILDMLQIVPIWGWYFFLERSKRKKEIGPDLSSLSFSCSYLLVVTDYWCLSCFIVGFRGSWKEFCNNENDAFWRWRVRTKFGSGFTVSGGNLQGGCSYSSNSQAAYTRMGSKFRSIPRSNVCSCLNWLLIIGVWTLIQARKDLVHCWSILLKHKVESNSCCVEYIEQHLELLDFLVVW